ncbi:MAG TPA: hypothetical protein VKX49_16125 [Bryobacteraceae bacterium]|nr:hypothetical protein [Bryobacteraceae bacterium]
MFYAKELALSPALVHVQPLNSLGIRGTPAVILVDSRGIVTGIWQGQLSEESEARLLAYFGAGGHTITDVSTGQWRPISNEEISKIAALANVIDVRPRESFDGNGVVPADNIPFDELQVRAAPELDPSKPVVIECSRTDSSQCDLAARILTNIETFRYATHILDGWMTEVSCNLGSVQ